MHHGCQRPASIYPNVALGNINAHLRGSESEATRRITRARLPARNSLGVMCAAARHKSEKAREIVVMSSYEMKAYNQRRQLHRGMAISGSKRLAK